MSNRPHRLLKTPSKDTTNNNEMPIENASVKSASSTGIRAKRKIRRTEDLMNLSLVLPQEKKHANVPKSPLQTISPNKNEVKKRRIQQLNKFGSELDEVKENLGAHYVSPRLKSPISMTDKKQKKQKQEYIDKNNGNTVNDTSPQKTSLHQGETSIEENVQEAASIEAHQRRVVVKAKKRLLKAQTTESAEEKSVVEKSTDENSADKEKQENDFLPPKNRLPQRKVVKAKRLLKSQNCKEKSPKIENSDTNIGITESNNSFVSELQGVLKKKRSQLQRQPHVSEDHVIVSKKVESPRNDESKSFDKTAKSEEVKKYFSELQEALKKRRSKMQGPHYVTEDHVIVSQEVKSPRNKETNSFDITEKSEDMEEYKKDASELEQALKKRRSKMPRPPYVTKDQVNVSEEVKSPRNEEKSFDKIAKSEQMEDNKKDASELQQASKKRRSKKQRPPYETEDHVIVSEVKSPRNKETNSFDITEESEDMEEYKKDASELEQALKKRRSKMPRPPYVTEDQVNVSEEVKSLRNEEKSFGETAKSEQMEDNKKDASELQQASKKRRSKMPRPPYVTEDHVIVSEEVKGPRNEESNCFDITEKSEEMEEYKKDASELQQVLKKRRSKKQRPPYETEDHVIVSEVKSPRNEETNSFDITEKSEEVEEYKKDPSELQEALKRRHSKMQTPPYVSEDHVIVSKEVKSPRNEDSRSFDKSAKSEEVEENKKDASVIIILDETILEESDESKNTVTVTTLKSPISPSTTSEMPSPIHFKSPIEKILHFDTSNEEIHPSTSGTIEQTAKRRTFELEKSINDITLLKSVSKNDSIRMSSFPSSDEDMSEPQLRQSKITVRRKWEIKNDRLSKISPPWLSPNDANEALKSDDSPTNENTDVENTPPRTMRKSQCQSLRKNLLTKGVSESGYIEKTPLKNERKSRSFSVSVEKTGTKSSTAKKHVSRVKMPNFAAIHQKKFDLMENLHDYKKRTEERAKMLLSGQKPVAFKTPICKKKKELRFAPGTHEKEQPLDFIPLPSTPMPVKRALRDSEDSVDIPKTLPIPNIFNFNPPRPVSTPKPTSVKKTESAKVQNKILTPKLQFNFKNLKLPEFKFGNPQFNFGKPQHSSNDFNRFGFKSRPEFGKKEEFKAMVASKSKPTKATVESRRVVIKGVRSNRRFDLLMEMRKGK